MFGPVIQSLLLVSLLGTSTAFNVAPSIATRPTFSTISKTPLQSTTTDDSPATLTTQTKRLTRDRYIASNRFHVRPQKGAKFEKRWATRKSRLAVLDGFRYFHLMRRVSLESSEDPLDDEFGNYVSFTVWSEKKHFNAWRKGDAFKEAHGGTSVRAFLSTMIGSAFVLKGAPSPAFYDGLLFQSTIPETSVDIVDGWRNVEADGVNRLPTECFVACNQFYVPSENAIAFEELWASRESKLKECDGFTSFGMLRRQTGGGGGRHGDRGVEGTDDPTYMSTTIWKDREAFNKWKEGNAFKAAHGGKDSTSSPKSKPLWSKPPSPIFYEGTLVISSDEGA